MTSAADASGGSAAAVAQETISHGVEQPVSLGLSFKALIAFCFVAIAVIGTYNAWTYPARFGYDFFSHYGYAEALVHHGHIPSQSQGGEYYTPPGYYAIAGAVVWVGQQFGMGHAERLGQQLNVLFVLATAFLVLVTARLLFPRRPVVWAAAVGFFAFLPVVTKVEAMFQPETLNMLVAAGVTTMATWMIVRRRFGKREFAALALMLAFEQLVRASGLFTLIGIGLSVGIVLLVERVDRKAALRGLAVGVGALLLLVLPWYARQAVKYHTVTPVSVVPGFARTMLHPGNSYIEQEGGVLHYIKLPLLELYRTPYREYFSNEAIPTTYADTWGDWIGSWEWDLSFPPNKHELRVLRDQMLIGAVPTLLALGGWAWLLVTGLRRRRELLPVALVLLFGFAGYLYRSYAAASNDGDVLKAAYVMLTAPMWALAFGVAFERVTRNGWVRVALVSLLAAFAGLELRFLVWGLRVGRGL